MSDKIVIFGAGHQGRAALRKCNRDKKLECVCFLDSDKKKHNTSVLKKKVYHITKINKINFDKIIFCGRYIKEQLKQVKKYNIEKNKFLIWGRSKILLPKQKLIQREKIILKMLTYVVKKFNQNQINYWMDCSGLLAIARKQHLAELNDVDISINSNDVKKIYKIIKGNKKIFSFNSEFISRIRKNKKITKTPMYIAGKTNPEIIEPPSIEFAVNKITTKQIKNLRKNTIYPNKYWKSFNIIKYKGLSLRVPNYHEKYLEHLYGKSWKKKAEFWSKKSRR